MLPPSAQKIKQNLDFWSMKINVICSLKPLWLLFFFFFFFSNVLGEKISLKWDSTDVSVHSMLLLFYNLWLRYILMCVCKVVRKWTTMRDFNGFCVFTDKPHIQTLTGESRAGLLFVRKIKTVFDKLLPETKVKVLHTHTHIYIYIYIYTHTHTQR